MLCQPNKPRHNCGFTPSAPSTTSTAASFAAQTSADTYKSQVSGSPAASLQLGDAFAKQGLDKYALACYQQALDLSPDWAKIHRQIGYYYLNGNNKAQARDYLSRSFQLNPNQPDVAGDLGRLGVAVKIPENTGNGSKKSNKTTQ